MTWHCWRKEGVNYTSALTIVQLEVPLDLLSPLQQLYQQVNVEMSISSLLPVYQDSIQLLQLASTCQLKFKIHWSTRSLFGCHLDWNLKCRTWLGLGLGPFSVQNTTRHGMAYKHNLKAFLLSRNKRTKMTKAGPAWNWKKETKNTRRATS